MSVDELWSLHELVVSELARKISFEQAELNQKLCELGQKTPDINVSSARRRPYPKVLPKYRNPARPSETWAGRGKQPRWLTEELRSGKKLDDFRIQSASSTGTQGTGRRNKGAAKRRSA